MKMKMKQLCFFTLIFLLSLSSSSFSTPPSDFQTLLSFKLISDPSDSILSSWSKSSHPCSWLGVTCNPNKNNTNAVTRLVLENLNLTGSIQPLTRLKHLRLLSLKNNTLSSPYSSLDFSSWKNMKLLYLSHNHFSLNFPSGINNLSSLRRLDLSYNKFSGEIPITLLTQLPHLLTLRLESNLFNGTLFGENFNNLYDFNVSYNNVSGEIPKSLSSFPLSSFIGNENLCGKPLHNQCSNQTIPSDPIPTRVPLEHKVRKLNGKAMVWILITYVSAVAAIGIGICLYCRKRKEREKKEAELMKKDGYGEMVVFQGCKGFKVDDLLKGSAELLGKGNVGSTYKVLLETGDVVVVKRVTRERKKRKEVEAILTDIGGLRNRNIVSLKGYYCSTDELLLVYDFLPNGSLQSLLHGNQWQGRAPMDWTTRLKYASGIAEGLAFLHNVFKSKLSHGHLTSSNVVIGQDGNACLSDVALEQLFLVATKSNNTYNAPELLLNTHNSSTKSSQASDVYSFGVILLEILTGKVATGQGETSLVKWVQSVGQEEWMTEVFDFELLRYKEMEEEMVALMQVALLCLSLAPRDRPKISAVVKMIEDIKVGKCRGTQQAHSPNDLTSHSSPSLSEGSPPSLAAGI